jgi:hypothetical protein
MNSTPVESAEWVNKVLERVFLSCRDSQNVQKMIIDSLNSEFVEIQRKHKFFVSSSTTRLITSCWRNCLSVFFFFLLWNRIVWLFIILIWESGLLRSEP